MKRRWHVRREAMERPDGRQRWDQAYQAILQWSLEDEQARAPRANDEEESMRVAAYVRVSTSRQVKLETTLSNSWRWYRGTRGRRDGSC